MKLVKLLLFVVLCVVVLSGVTDAARNKGTFRHCFCLFVCCFVLLVNVTVCFLFISVFVIVLGVFAFLLCCFGVQGACILLLIFYSTVLCVMLDMVQIAPSLSHLAELLLIYF